MQTYKQDCHAGACMMHSSWWSSAVIVFIYVRSPAELITAWVACLSAKCHQVPLSATSSHLVWWSSVPVANCSVNSAFSVCKLTTRANSRCPFLLLIALSYFVCTFHSLPINIFAIAVFERGHKKCSYSSSSIGWLSSFPCHRVHSTH